jgi:hypothetical protein
MLEHCVLAGTPHLNPPAKKYARSDPDSLRSLVKRKLDYLSTNLYLRVHAPLLAAMGLIQPVMNG